ncbi:DUF86 domain-containing protein [Patescibacteria group bacterium]|nr:DUF86 domain-containing protein [Patescibacteria group bacterium]MBU4347767.1 DUF86 domain-containing protein [Patescibacteria group bacterium]MBU4454954.1 DUF86 domain-containing protein [Patescibacteria group bacterium]MCG2690845.1 DUF86 domain-containing protein [Candidatus Parcubacteria bacterium]
MDKDPKIFLQHILESINYIEDYTKNLSKDEFFSSVQIQDSVFRRLEVIGEATKNIPDDFKTITPHIPWRKIAGMRDKLIHEYFGIDKELVWETVQILLPKFKEEIIKLLK